MSVNARVGLSRPKTIWAFLLSTFGCNGGYTMLTGTKSTTCALVVAWAFKGGLPLSVTVRPTM